MRVAGSLDLVARAIKGLYHHAVTGKSDPAHYEPVFHLMIKSNGAFADVINFAHRHAVSRQRFDATSGTLGPVTVKQRSEAVRSLRRDGYYVFPQRIPEATLDAICSAMDTSPALIFPRPGGSPSYGFYDSRWPRGAYYYRQLHRLPVVQQLMVDENFAALATDYFGCDPILHTMQQWISPAMGKVLSGAGQLYHFDVSNLKWMNVFIYLTDVTPDTGPHCLIRGSHRVTDIPSAPLRWKGVVRLSDAEVDAAYPKDRHVEVCGKRGTVLCVDTRTCHKGMHPLMAERRIMALYYVNSTFGVSGEYHDIEDPTPKLIAANERWPRLLYYFNLMH